MKMKKAAHHIFWHLPPELRRKLAPSVLPKRHESFQGKLQPNAEERFGSTLKPFVDHKCIFVHIPKSAGLSVTDGLFGAVTGSHIKLVEYQTMFSRQEFDQFFKFTFVRNPWDRLVSAFFYLKKGGINANNLKWSRKNLDRYDDFDTFAKRWVNEKNVYSHLHFMPQHLFICLPRKRNPAVDFIGYYEHLEADYDFIRGRIGVGTELEAKNVTSDRNRDYRQYYSEETKRIVADAYHRDIELFEYDFDNESVQEVIANRTL